jgi:hypothetical protein
MLRIHEGTDLTTEDTRGARSACRDLLVAYLTVVDHHRAMEAMPCFTEDAQIVARGQQLNGREKMSRALVLALVDMPSHGTNRAVGDHFRQPEFQQSGPSGSPIRRQGTAEQR